MNISSKTRFKIDTARYRLQALMLYLLLAIVLHAKLADMSSSVMGLYQQNHAEQLLNRIMLINNNNHNKDQLKSGHKDEPNKKIAFFLSQLTATTTTGATETGCSTKMMQTNVQAKMRSLRSIISACSGYCRLSMDQHGLVYGANNFSLESMT